MFGSLEKRKGIEKVYCAYSDLPPALKEQIGVICAGKLDKTISSLELLINAPEKNVNQNRDFQIVDRYLDDEEIRWLVESCNIVLAPYLNHKGSSGVIYWATRYGKPVLGQDYGLMGALVEDNRLGWTVDTSNTHSLLEVFTSLPELDLKKAFNVEKLKEFSERNTAQSFAREITKALENL